MSSGFFCEYQTITCMKSPYLDTFLYKLLELRDLEFSHGCLITLGMRVLKPLICPQKPSQTETMKKCH